MKEQTKILEKQNNPSKSIKMARTLMPILGKIAPNFSSKLFFKLFTTPIKVPLKPPHLEILNQSTPFEYLIQDIWGYQEEVKIRGYEWNPKGKQKVLLVHGWNGKAADYYKLIPKLIESDFHVEAIDCKAHGASEGNRSSMPDFMESIKGYVENRGVPDIVIGHSLGATASTFYLSESGFKIDKLILLANPVIMMNAFSKGFDQVNLPDFARNLVVESAEKMLKRKISDFDLQNVSLSNFNNVLELYVENDDEVSNNDTLLFLKAHPNVSAQLIENCGHNYIKRNKKAIELIMEFLKK